VYTNLVVEPPAHDWYEAKSLARGGVPQLRTPGIWNRSGYQADIETKLLLGVEKVPILTHHGILEGDTSLHELTLEMPETKPADNFHTLYSY
jgi:hypothetical protein